MSQLLKRFDGDMIDLNDKTILVTGGTGSFGQQFIRTVLENFDMRRCIVFSRDEQKHYDMLQRHLPICSGQHQAILLISGY